ncbi:MAG TPA: calcium/sodium antiporter [Candidatus Cloacimonadota bacterium]|nr:calcium/sodium antiporter [Candidatus Cloacimonadota bacterium]
MILSTLLLLCGFATVILGAEGLVRGASSLGVLLKVPQIVIGLTVVAFGTSTPELVVNLFSSVEGHGGIVFGNVIGSNLMNLLFILGLAAAIKPVMIRKHSLRIEIPLSLLATLLLAFLVNDRMGGPDETNLLSRTDGLVLLTLFGVFLGYTHWISSRGEAAESGEVKTYSIWLSLLMIAGGLAGLVLGGRLVVDKAVLLAEALGVSQKVIGLTIVAVGTSLPELATSVVAALKGHSDIAVGNVVGSNIFNLLLILGISGLIRPAAYDLSFNTDLVLLSLATLLLIGLAWIKPRRKFNRLKGWVFVSLYIVYLVWLVS